MLTRLHLRTVSERGFTLIEVLVVLLIIGILAAIAIPSLLSQKSKALDASAKEVARTGEQAAEVYATDHGGVYTGMEAKALKAYEPVLQIEAVNNGAYLSVAESKEGGAGYVVSAKSANGDTFSYTRTENGSVSRTCEIAAGGTATTCQSGTW